MSTTEWHMIGFKELYDQLVQLNAKVDTGLVAHTIQITELTGRVNTLEQATSRRWQVNLALATSGVAVLSAFLAPLVLR